MIFCKSLPSKVPQSYWTRGEYGCVCVGLYVEIHQYSVFPVQSIFVYCCKSASRVKSCLSDKYLYNFTFLLLLSTGVCLIFVYFIIGPLCRFVASKGCFLEQFKEGDNSIPSKRVKSYVQPSQSEVPARILAEFALDPRNRFSLEFLLFMNVYTSFSPKCGCVYYTIFCSSLDMSDSPGFYLVQSVSGSRVWKQFKQAKCES